MGKSLCSALVVLFVLLCVCGPGYPQQPAPAYPPQPARGYPPPPPPGYGYRVSTPFYGSYIVMKGGAFYPQEDIKELDTGFNGELAYGFRFNRFVAMEYSSGYFDTSGTFRGPFARSGLSFEGDVYAIPLTMALKLNLPLSPWFDLYGLAGGGGYYIHAKGTFTGPNGRRSGSDDAGVLGGFLGAGFNFNFARQFFLGVEGKYLWTSNADFRVSIGGDRFDVDLRIEGIQAAATLGYRF